MIQRAVILAVAAAFVCGCTGKIEDRIETMAADQKNIAARLDALEQENLQLREALTARSAPSVGTPTPAEAEGATETGLNISPELAEVLADRINTLLQEKITATIEDRIDSRIGSRGDIEAIFSQAVEEEMDNREEQERLEREQQRWREIAERDRRTIERRAESAGFDDEKKQDVTLAMQEMRERIREQLPALKEREAGMEEMLAVVAESRQVFDRQLLETLSEEELAAYNETDRWYRNRQNRVQEITTAAKLDDAQSLLVDDAYKAMRGTMGDGFLLMSEGYAGREEMRQTFRTTQETFTQSLKTIMTPEQYEAYESSDAARWERGFRGGRGR